MKTNRTLPSEKFMHKTKHFFSSLYSRSTYSPESDVGYGTSFGSQELSGHTLDMDILSNLVVCEF